MERIFENRVKKREREGRESFSACVEELLRTSVVRSMEGYVQHGDVSCLEHCYFVALLSYRICCFLQLDARAAARGGLLHDLFLYDWHKTPNPRGLHGFYHPVTALENADAYFELNNRERDVIAAHMWPLTLLRPPRTGEAAVVCAVDKVCTLAEMADLYRITGLRERFGAALGRKGISD